MSFEFIFDSEKLLPGTDLKNIIKVPVVFCAETVKFYSEIGKHLFMPYSEIKDAINWHREHLPRLPITLEHIKLFDSTGEVYVPSENEIIGYASQFVADDEKKRAKGWAYITQSKIHPQVADALLRGHLIGVSVGGFAGEFGPPGFYDGQKYDASQMKLKFHHIALIIQSLPRCPMNICGFNFKDSESLKECVNRKIPIIKNEHPDWTHEHIVAASMGYCKNKMKHEDSFDISAEKPSEDFKDFHESLILNSLLDSKSCVHEFYKYYQDAIREPIIDGINNNEGQLIDHNLLSNTKIEAIHLSEDQLKLLNEQIKELKAENDTLKNSKFADAEKQIKELQEANKEFADANAKLQEDLKVLTTQVMSYQKDEITKMQRTLFDSKKFSAEQIKAMDYNTLKSTYDIAKLFVDSSPGQVLRPTPATNYSTLPRPAPQNNIADSEKATPPRIYRLGMPPPMDVILDGDNDHWKSRFGKTPNGGN